MWELFFTTVCALANSVAHGSTPALTSSAIQSSCALLSSTPGCTKGSAVCAAADWHVSKMAIATHNAQSIFLNFEVFIVSLQFNLFCGNIFIRPLPCLNLSGRAWKKLLSSSRLNYFAVTVRVIVVLTTVEPEVPVTVKV